VGLTRYVNRGHFARAVIEATAYQTREVLDAMNADSEVELKALKVDDSLSGMKILVTAGPTIEDIDPVRFLSNRSSGKMGYAVAEAALRRGAEVHLVSGPTSLQAPHGARLIRVRSAAEMKDAVLEIYPDMDVVVKAAAVADYRPAKMAKQKLKKKKEEVGLHLVPTDDILEMLGRQKKGQVLIGFAAETERLLESARDKMNRKNLDLLVANDVSSGVFGSDTSTVHILRKSGEPEILEGQTKQAIADRILDIMVESRRSKV